MHDLLENNKISREFSMKYFLNIGDSIVDLLSSTIERKDIHQSLNSDASTGSFEVNWCKSHNINSFQEFISLCVMAESNKQGITSQYDTEFSIGHSVVEIETNVTSTGTSTDTSGKKSKLYLIDLTGYRSHATLMTSTNELCGKSNSPRHQHLRRDDNNNNTNNNNIHSNTNNNSSSTHDTTNKQISDINNQLAEFTDLFIRTPSDKASCKSCAIASVTTTNIFLFRYVHTKLHNNQRYLICTVRPEAKHLADTVRTLRFATTAAEHLGYYDNNTYNVNNNDHDNNTTNCMKKIAHLPEQPTVTSGNANAKDAANELDATNNPTSISTTISNHIRQRYISKSKIRNQLKESNYVHHPALTPPQMNQNHLIENHSVLHENADVTGAIDTKVDTKEGSSGSNSCDAIFKIIHSGDSQVLMKMALESAQDFHYVDEVPYNEDTVY